MREQRRVKVDYSGWGVRDDSMLIAGGWRGQYAGADTSKGLSRVVGRGQHEGAETDQG